MIRDDILKLAAVASLVVIAICSVITAIHVETIRKNTNALRNFHYDPAMVLPVNDPRRRTFEQERERYRGQPYEPPTIP